MPRICILMEKVLATAFEDIYSVHYSFEAHWVMVAWEDHFYIYISLWLYIPPQSSLCNDYQRIARRTNITVCHFENLILRTRFDRVKLTTNNYYKDMCSAVYVSR